MTTPLCEKEKDSVERGSAPLISRIPDSDHEHSIIQVLIKKIDELLIEFYLKLQREQQNF